MSERLNLVFIIKYQRYLYSFVLLKLDFCLRKVNMSKSINNNEVSMNLANSESKGTSEIE